MNCEDKVLKFLIDEFNSGAEFKKDTRNDIGERSVIYNHPKGISIYIHQDFAMYDNVKEIYIEGYVLSTSEMITMETAIKKHTEILAKRAADTYKLTRSNHFCSLLHKIRN